MDDDNVIDFASFRRKKFGPEYSDLAALVVCFRHVDGLEEPYWVVQKFIFIDGDKKVLEELKFADEMLAIVHKQYLLDEIAEANEKWMGHPSGKEFDDE